MITILLEACLELVIAGLVLSAFACLLFVCVCFYALCRLIIF
jgi:hypothetical protein